MARAFLSVVSGKTHVQLINNVENIVGTIGLTVWKLANWKRNLHFSLAQISENCGPLRNHDTSLSVSMASRTISGWHKKIFTNSLALSEHIHLVGRPLNCLGPGEQRELSADIWSHTSCVLRRVENRRYFMSRASLARTSSLSSQNSRVPFTKTDHCGRPVLTFCLQLTSGRSEKPYSLDRVLSCVCLFAFL